MPDPWYKQFHFHVHFQPGLLFEHLVHHHPQHLVQLVFQQPGSGGGSGKYFYRLLSNIFAVSPERHAVCSLCGQRFLRRHAKLLAFHLQQQHRDTMLALLHHTNQVNYIAHSYLATLKMNNVLPGTSMMCSSIT